MDADRARRFLLTLPHVAETMQWGDNLVFWVGDKAIGGKMFALINLDRPESLVISFAAGPERSADLCELEGIRPAPYLARAHWVAAERWDALPARSWEVELRAAHAITMGRLPRRTQQALAMPAKERTALIAERRKLLAAKPATQAAAPANKSATDRNRGTGSKQKASVNSPKKTPKKTKPLS